MRRTLGAFACVILGCSRDPAPPPASNTTDDLVDRIARSAVHTAGEAHVRAAIPSRADEVVRVDDAQSSVGVTFVLDGASAAAARPRGDVTVFPAAYRGADVVMRSHLDGLEDYVVFAAPPAREVLEYRVDVSRVAGLRVARETLELLDATGTPRLRIAPPRVIDRSGSVHDAHLEVAGCNLDARPGLPWGREPIAPGASSCTVRVSWHDVSYPLAVDPNWTSTKAMAYARVRHTATPFGNEKVLLAGGCNGPLKAGYCQIMLDSAEVFDASSETFTTLTATMTSTRRSHSATLLATGDVLLAGGCYTDDYKFPCANPVDTADLFDALTLGFSPVAGADGGTSGALTIPRSDQAAAVLSSGHVLLVGGYTSANVATSTVEIYDPSQKAFAAVSATMATPRVGSNVSALASGRVLIAGGANGAFKLGGTSQPSAEIFDEVKKDFVATADLTTARADAATVLLKDSRVLVVGGSASGALPLTTAEIFDETANAGVGIFTPTTGSMSAAADVLATLLPNGQVLVKTGYGTSCELFDPKTSEFLPTGTLPIFAFGPSMTTLSTGKVLLAGGQPNALDPPLSSAFLFVLASNGAACSDDVDCDSRTCRNNVCCVAECKDCQVCAIGTGACVPFVNGELGTCSGDHVCDYSGQCKHKRGQACTGSTDCASGVCTDGVCCNESCTDACQICNAPKLEGTCVAVSDTKGARQACPEGFVCNGQSRVCAPALCNDHIANPTGQASIDCFPYKCNVLGACVDSCTSADQCAAPAVCDPTGHCVEPKANGGGGCATSSDEAASRWIVVLLAGALGAMFRNRRGRRRSG